VLLQSTFVHYVTSLLKAACSDVFDLPMWL